MGFLIRAAIVVGIVYALSPLRDDRVKLSREAAGALDGVPARAADAALAVCGAQPSCLARAVGLAAQAVAPAPAGGPRPAEPRAGTSANAPRP